jgi:hypothetical protein
MSKGIKYDFVVAKTLKKGEKYHHLILTDGTDSEVCREKVSYFFEHYQLVRYFHTNILDRECLSASSPEFWDALEQARLKNREILHTLITELRGEGVQTLLDLESLPQGYQSNMLHVITHILDGFFGIDSYFYNLIEDSHWVSEALLEKMKISPSRYRLIHIEADFK